MATTLPKPQKVVHGLGTLLRLPYQAMMTDVVEPALASAGFDDIRAAHLPVVQALAMNPDGLRSTELATYARMTKQSMGYLVDHLSGGGYVERVPDPTDMRAKVVRLTPLGWQLGSHIRDIVLGVEAEWANAIGQDRMQELKTILREIVAQIADRPETT